MAFKIYTKTGDEGITGLFGGMRVAKFHSRVEAYGTLDELNSHLGLLADLLATTPYLFQLREVQDRLFTLGAYLASDPSKANLQRPDLHADDVTVLEHAIDVMEETLPMLKNFILPGGHPTVSQAHIARTVCRRAERLVVELFFPSEIEEENTPLDALAMQYLNRLSDYLFVLSRKIALDLGVEEIAWQPRK